MRHVYWAVGRVRQIPSLFGVGGETGYAAQEDLKSAFSYNMGEGRTIRVWFFRFLHSKTLLGFFLFFRSWDTRFRIYSSDWNSYTILYTLAGSFTNLFLNFFKALRSGSWKCQFSSVTQSCPTLCDPMDCKRGW